MTNLGSIFQGALIHKIQEYGVQKICIKFRAELTTEKNYIKQIFLW